MISLKFNFKLIETKEKVLAFLKFHDLYIKNNLILKNPEKTQKKSLFKKIFVF